MNQKEIISKVREAVESDPNKDYIQSIYLFGSFLHGDATDNSDVDLLFEPRKSMGFFKLFDIQYHLEHKLNKKVDLRTKEDLSKYFRNEVTKEAKRIYDHDEA